MISVVQYQGVCCCSWTKKRQQDHEEKTSTCSEVSGICFRLASALTQKHKPDLSPSFCLSALRGPFDSRKGKTCQNRILDCEALPFIPVIHPLLLLWSDHSSVVSHESYRWKLCVSLCTWPLLTSSLDLFISPLCCCLKSIPRDCLIEDYDFVRAVIEVWGCKISSMSGFS